MALAILMNAAGLIQFFAEVHESPDEKVEAAIIVIVEPDCARRPPWGGYSSLLCHVGKATVAVVVIENTAPVLSDVQVRETVTIVVAHSYALPVSAAPHPGFFGYVGESPVSVVFI
jgi:hypothetical protein